MNTFPPLQQPLSDGVVSLRLAAERDIPEVLIAYEDDPELHLRLDEPRPPSGAALGRRAEQAEAERRAGASVTLTIIEAEDDSCRGEIRVPAVDWENLRAELVVWVAPDRRGRGVGRRALRLAATWLVRECGLERVGLMAHPEHHAVIRAAEAAGFIREGLLRGYTRGGDRRVDAVVLSLVRADLSG